MLCLYRDTAKESEDTSPLLPQSCVELIFLQKLCSYRGTARIRGHITRVGQNRIYTPYMTVYLVISLPKIPYIHRIYMVLANPTHYRFCSSHVWMRPFSSMWRVGQIHKYHIICPYVGLARTIYIYGVHTVFLAWKSSNIRCKYTYIYGSGQPYPYTIYINLPYTMCKPWP